MPRVLSLAVLTLVCLLTACGGGGSGSSSSTGTTTDMGTIAAVDDTDQYSIENAASGMVLGISGQSQTAGTYVVQEEASTTTADIDWHFMPMGNTQYNVENMLTHQVLGILNASTSSGAQALEYPDNGTNDHLWAFYKLTDGNYLIKNVNSGLYLEDANSGTTSSATIDQSARSTTSTGCTCQEWKLTSTNTVAYPSPMTVSGTGIYVHDPFLMQDPATHLYWLYGTHQTLAYSTDLSTFTYTTTTSAEGACTSSTGTGWLTVQSHCPIIGPDFTSWSGLQTPPSYNNGTNIDVWAPSLLYNGGTYYLYYAVPYEPSTGAEAVIGLATSTSPYGPWTDEGYVVTSWTDATTAVPATNPWGFTSTTTWNAIDPAPFVDASGNWWLVFGSWSDGIRVLQLQSPSSATSASTVGQPVSTDTSTWTKVAYRSAGEEGPFIYPYVFNGTQYYYYFAPINTCCSGTSSTYRTIVGRSTSPSGPFVDRGGIALTSGGGTILVSSHGNIYGPGGGSVLTDTGSDGASSIPTFVYHYYDGNNNGTPTLGINRLGFTSDGWPYLE
ncbi:MAG: family 43 glycosylhydrolase [Acidobacteriaceae bacterium]|nr:family 43 glycosylhydrolase [Acidobacteriaceae bacterium]